MIISGTALRVALYPMMDDTGVRGFLATYDVQVSNSDGTIEIHHFYLKTNEILTTFEGMYVTVDSDWVEGVRISPTRSIIINNYIIKGSSIRQTYERIRTLQEMGRHREIPEEFRPKIISLFDRLNPGSKKDYSKSPDDW